MEFPHGNPLQYCDTMLGYARVDGMAYFHRSMTEHESTNATGALPQGNYSFTSGHIPGPRTTGLSNIRCTAIPIEPCKGRCTYETQE